MNKKIILLTSGDPSGIGPDICLDIIMHNFNQQYAIVVIGDSKVLEARAKLLHHRAKIHTITQQNLLLSTDKDTINVLNIPCVNPNVLGQIDKANASYVLNTLDTAISWCKNKLSNIIVTAPVSKEAVSKSGVKFSGHTEYFAKNFAKSRVVMMLANQYMKVALLTTHIPLKDVVSQITPDNLDQTLTIIFSSLTQKYGIKHPKIAVCGLNPHSGEGGYMGTEEVNIINPVIKDWQDRGYAVSGTYSADTIFLHAKSYDVILAMYHDQGLPVLKYAGFGTGINITLGLPIIRTSVDHGTAFSLAGTGKASSDSLVAAIEFAINCDMGIK